MSNCKDIWFQCETIIHSQVTLKEKMQAICNFLGSQMPAYDWVGFYLSDVKNKKLHLGPFMENQQNILLFHMARVFVGKQQKLKKHL